MKTTAEPVLIELLPCFRLGEITAEIECRPSSGELLTRIKESVKDIRNKYYVGEISKLAVIASTRNAYKKTGNDPSRYRPSAEALLRRIVKGSDLYIINNAVDTLNLISIQSGYSIGGYDRDTLAGDIEIGIGRKGEPYYGIGKGLVNIHNLPVLRDRKDAFGSPTSDSERTMIISQTKKILFVFFDFGLHESLHLIMKNCCGLLEKFCEAKNFQMETFNFS